MPIKKEYIREGVRLTHQSGVVTVTSIEALRRLKEMNQGMISFYKKQIEDLGIDIKAIEALQ